MSFLSRYRLSLSEARSLHLTDTYSLHRIVYGLFDEFSQKKMEERKVLFADQGGDARERRLLILSAHQPHIPECGTLECKNIPDAFLTFSTYRFEVTLNPSRRNNSSRKIIPVLGSEAITEWFLQKAPGLGFTARTDTLLVTKDYADSFIKNNQKVTLNKATVTGFLDVIDPSLFKHTVLNGIGRARAFGCGLLQIVPAG